MRTREDELARAREQIRKRREDPEYRAREQEKKKARRATPQGKEERRKERRNDYARKTGRPLVRAPFVGVDGEGGEDAQGRHNYYYLRAGKYVLETGKPLTWEECFTFLAGLPTNAIYVGYFFDYDVTMMTASMPPHKIRRLLDRDKRFRPGFFTPLPVDIGEFDIDYVAGKFFKVRRRTPPDAPRTPYVEISDVGRFFQQTFLKSLATWNIGSDEERAAIARGKAARATFGKMNTEIREYNALEIRLLENLMEEFRSACEKIGHAPVKWQGPGDLASALLKYHAVPKKNELVLWENKELLNFANTSYYGGRFETSAVGAVPGPTYNLDINSAYPHALTSLPCLLHGRWELTKKGKRPTSPLYLAYASAHPKDDVYFYGLPFRNKYGGVSYPGQFSRGVFWNFELDAAIHQDTEIVRAWSYHRDCECELFAWIEALYQARLEMKKDARGKVIKLALNSLYGKMAQRVGAAPYNNYIWSSYITAYTRTQIQKLIHSLPACKAGRCGEDVWMIATDGLYTSALPEGFRISEKLGGWDMKEYTDGIFIVQPGLYFDNTPNTDTRLTRTRGLPSNKALEHEAQFREKFEEVLATGDPTDITVPIPLTTFHGIRTAMHRGKPELAGQWSIETRNIGFDWRSKRRPLGITRPGHIRTKPPDGDWLAESRPYDKTLADKLDARIADIAIPATEQPDFRADILTNPQTQL